MTTLKNKTFWMRKEDVQREWYHIDAAELVMGKVAVKAARALMGKNKPTWTPGVDVGNFVVITNASKIVLTGQKLQKKVYRYHTGYIGGLVEQTYGEVMEKKPEQLVELAVRRMLPKNKLGRAFFKRLKVYAGDAHPHSAQKLVSL